MNKGRVSEKEGSHRRQSLTEARVPQKARPHRGSHRKAGLHRRQRPLNKGRVSQKARPHRSQGLTEGEVSQRAKPHRKQGVSLIAGTHIRHVFTSETKA